MIIIRAICNHCGLVIFEGMPEDSNDLPGISWLHAEGCNGEEDISIGAIDLFAEVSA